MGIVQRLGALTAESLADAIEDEKRRGNEPYAVVVDSHELYVTAMESVRDASPFAAVAVTMARVEIDPLLSEREWGLRTRDSTA